MVFRQFSRINGFSAGALALIGLLGLADRASAASVTLCPNAASNQNGAGTFTFSSVAGPLDGTCGANSAVKMDIPTEVDYARLAWVQGDPGYPSPLTVGNLTSLSADIRFSPGQPADQPFYLLSFVDPTQGLGQTNATDQILFIEFQTTNYTGNTMPANRSTTLFNMFDNTAGFYLNGPNGQQNAKTLDAWLALDPFLANDAIDQLRVGIGLSGGGSSPESLTINSLTVTTAGAAPVPEPATFLLLGTGLAAVVVRRRWTSRG